MDKGHSAKDFLAKLRDGSLRPSPTRVGMAKHGDGDVLLFSESESCGGWVAVSLDLVESVEVIAWAACKDHTHPVVRLRLLEPAADNKHARLLADLLAARDAASVEEPADGVAGGPGAARRRGTARGHGDPTCLASCQDGCTSGPPFLTGRALGACLRACRSECGYR